MQHAAEKIRRLALLGLVVMVVIVGASYGVRRWRAEQTRRTVSTSVPEDVKQQAEAFTFSRTEEGRTLFTVEAARTIDRAGKTTTLENVVVRIFGREGQHKDEIRTDRCEYDQGGTGRILCPNEVRVSLERGEGVAANTGDAIQLTTTALQFDPATGTAWTDEPVRFSFPEGTGESVGLRYRPTEPRVLLENQVSIQVERGPGSPVDIRGAGLGYFTGTRVFELQPPLSLRVANRTLVADSLRMHLRENFQTDSIEATGHVRAAVRQDGRRLTLSAARARAEYSPAGNIQRVRASGEVEFIGKGASSEERVNCREAVFQFGADGRTLQRVQAQGDARLVSLAGEESRELRAPEMELVLPGKGETRQVLTSRKRGTLLLRQAGQERRSIVADQIELTFEGGRELRRLAASGRVETREPLAGGGTRTTTSEELRAQFGADGALQEAEQWERFRYDDGSRQAQAGRAHYRVAEGIFRLRESPVIWDRVTRTSAELIEVSESAGQLEAQGNVRTTRQASAGSAGGFQPGQPVQLAADRLHASEKEGWARYEGNARLWQGENRLAGRTIELRDAPARLLVDGEVSALFFDTPETGQSTAARKAVRVRAERFTYTEADHRGVFERAVRAENDFGRLTASRLEVFLSSESGTDAGRLERAEASGAVRIEQGGGEASSEHAEYRPVEQTVVLWGGTPTLAHPQRGSTTGARLTLFLADDKLLVDSEKGTRTVTRRPRAQ